MRLILTLLATVLVTTACSAGEAEIRKNIEARFPGAKVDSVTKTPVSGIYEVVVDGDQVIYSDGKAGYVIVGEMLETKDKRNLTRERLDKLQEVKFDTLPLDQAIKVVRGDYTFTFGPQISYRKNDNVVPFFHALFGGGGASAGFGGLSFSNTAFAMNIGGGLDWLAHRRCAIRAIQLDLLVTGFGADASFDPRISAGIVLRFGSK